MTCYIHSRDSSLVEGLCVNLIFGTRGEAWIYSDHPTGALSIAVSLSVRPLSHTILCVSLLSNPIKQLILTVVCLLFACFTVK